MVIKKGRTTRKNPMKKNVHKKFKRKTKKMYGGDTSSEEEDDDEAEAGPRRRGRGGVRRGRREREPRRRTPEQLRTQRERREKWKASRVAPPPPPPVSTETKGRIKSMAEIRDEINAEVERRKENDEETSLYDWMNTHSLQQQQAKKAAAAAKKAAAAAKKAAAAAKKAAAAEKMYRTMGGFPNKDFWYEFIKEEREIRANALKLSKGERWGSITSCGQPKGDVKPGTIPTNLSSEFSQANIGECCSWWNKTFIANAIPKNIGEDLFDAAATATDRKNYLRNYILPFHRAIRGGDLSKFYAPHDKSEQRQETKSIKWNNNNRMKWYEEAKNTFDFYNLEGEKYELEETKETKEAEDPLISKYYKPSLKWEKVATTMLKDVPRENLSEGVWNDPLSGKNVNIGPVLSIDPPHTDDADDAFCIYKDAAGKTHIMVHIADPSAFTKLFTPDWYRMCQQSETRYAYSSGADGTAPLHLIAGDKVKYISLQNNGYYTNDVKIDTNGDIIKEEKDPSPTSGGGEKFALSQDFIIIEDVNINTTSRIGRDNFDMVPNGVPFFSTIWVENQGLFMYSQVTNAMKASDEKGKKKVHWGNLSADMQNKLQHTEYEWLPLKNPRVDFVTRDAISSNDEIRDDIIQRLQAFMKITEKTQKTRLLGMSWASLTKEVEAIELGDFRNDELGDYGFDNDDCTEDDEFDSHDAIAELAIRMNQTITIFLCQCQKNGVIPSFIKRNFPGVDNDSFGTIPKGASYCGGYSFCGTQDKGYNLLHKGVGNTYYSHITSPMRRLPDLISHMDLRWIMILNTKNDGENMLPRSCFPIIQNEINKEKMKKIVEKFPNPFWSDEANYASICLLSTINFIKKFNSKMTHFNNKFKVLQRIKNDHYNHYRLLETRQPTESKEPSKNLQLKLRLAYPLNDLSIWRVTGRYLVTQQPHQQKEIDIAMSHYKKEDQENGDWSCKFGSSWARLKQPMFIKIAPWTDDGKDLKTKKKNQHQQVLDFNRRKQTYGFLPDENLPPGVRGDLEEKTKADTVFIDKMKTRGANIQWRERKTQGTTKGNMDPGNYTWVNVSQYPPTSVNYNPGEIGYYSNIKAPRDDWLKCLNVFLQSKTERLGSTSDTDQDDAVEIAYTKGWDYVLAYFAPAADFNKGKIPALGSTFFPHDIQVAEGKEKKQTQVDDFLQMSLKWGAVERKRREKEVDQSEQQEEKKEGNVMDKMWLKRGIIKRLPAASNGLELKDKFVKDHAWVILQNIKLYLNADIADKRIVLSKEWKNLYCSVMNIPDFGDDDDKIELKDFPVSSNRVYSPLIQIETGEDDCSNILPFNFYPYRTRALKLDFEKPEVFSSKPGFSWAVSTPPTKKKVVFDFDVNQRFKWKRSFAMVEDNIFLPKGETPTPIQLGEGGIGYIVDIGPSYEVAVEAMPGQIGKYENFEGAQKISIPPYYKEGDRDIRLLGYFKKEDDGFSYFRDKLKKSTFNGLFTKLKEGMKRVKDAGVGKLKPTDVAAAAVDEAHNTPATDKESKEETRHTTPRVAPPTQKEYEEWYGYETDTTLPTLPAPPTQKEYEEWYGY
jgi:hypothetical protein